MANDSVLVVEDEEIMRSILRQLLVGAGFDVFTADSAESGLEIFAAKPVDVVLTDIKMAGQTGLDLLDRVKDLDGEAAVVVMTAFSSVDTAVAALRKGAYDYITKPFINEDLVQTVRNAAAQRRLFRENRMLRRELHKHYNFSDMVGQSEVLKKVFEIVSKVAPTSANVLIQGESGTGKELVARSIHFNSTRSDKPFLAVNCGALTESLLESELFGHVKGSFTGAASDKKGLFRSVEGGTLLLDEVGEMPPSLQIKLLRALQDRHVTPVGAAGSIAFDARIIAATNRNLETEVAEGRFREDLYYRLNVVEIYVPPLRQRRDDIPLLVKHFVGITTRAQDTPERAVASEAMDALLNYDWPGNIRQLQHVIERAVILSGDEIDLDSLPDQIRNTRRAVSSPNGRPSLDDVEREYIQQVLAEEDGNKSDAAKALGIDLSTLYRKLKRYDLE